MLNVEGYFKASSDYRSGRKAKRITGRAVLLEAAVNGRGRLQELAAKALMDGERAKVEPSKNHKRAGA